MTLRRLLIIVLCGLLAILVGRDAVWAYWRLQDPMNAPKVIANEPSLNVRKADRYLSDPELFSTRSGEIGDNAAAALRSDPLNAAAMRQLGMVAAAARANAASPYWATAERISRRDLPAQLLLIEQSVQNGDVAETLSHYDRALLVYPDAGQQLYPVLAQAMADPVIRLALAKYASRNWVAAFLAQAIDLGGDPAAVIGLMAETRRKLAPRVAENLETMLIAQLVAHNQFAAVRDMVRHMPGGASRVIDQFGLSAATSNARLAPLVWTIANSDAIETALDDVGGLAITVASERSGKVAQRVTLLPPGEYVITQTLSYEAGTPHAALKWTVDCMGGASAIAIWQHSLPIILGKATYHAEFTVPQACEAQSWHLQATAAETQIASTATVSSLTLARQ